MHDSHFANVIPILWIGINRFAFSDLNLGLAGPSLGLAGPSLGLCLEGSGLCL